MRITTREAFLPTLEALQKLQKIGSPERKIAKGERVARVSTLPSNITVLVDQRAYRRWPKDKAILTPFVFVSLSGIIIAAAVCGLLLHTYTEAYFAGAASGQSAGSLGGSASTCLDVTNWARWATNAEADKVRSKQDTPAVGAKVGTVIAAAVDYACAKKFATPNPYEPPKTK